jgi:hypothetical protein
MLAADRNEPLFESLKNAGRITAQDVQTLRRDVFNDGVVSDEEAQMVFDLDHACAEKDDAWCAFYVDALTDYLVWQSDPRGYVSKAQADFLIKNLTHDGQIASGSELELLVNVIYWSKGCPESLPLLAIEAVHESIINPGRACYGKGRRCGVIDEGDVELLRKVLYAGSSLGSMTITRREAELLFTLNNESIEADNHPSWSDLFVKGVANYLMWPQRTPERPCIDEARRREAWMDERRGVGNLLSGIGSAVFNGSMFEELRKFDPFGRETARNTYASRVATGEAAFQREKIDAPEAIWLKEQIASDGILHDNEIALLSFLKAESPQLDQALADLFDQAGIS